MLGEKTPQNLLLQHEADFQMIFFSSGRWRLPLPEDMMFFCKKEKRGVGAFHLIFLCIEKVTSDL